jgi:flagellar FliJ protein
MARVKKSKRMKVVLDQAERNEHAALEQMTAALRYFDDQKAQMLSLKDYHAQYMSDMKHGQGSVLSVAQLQSNLHFVNQIDAAIQQQQLVMDQAQKAFNIAKEKWTALHQKTKGLADLIERYKEEERILEDKQEQKQLEDALQARLARRN